MSISSLNFGNNPTNIQKPTNKLNNKNNSQTLQEQPANKNVNIPKLTRTQNALASGAFGFGFSFLIDRGLGLLMKSFKTPLKTSLAFNGAFGLITGIATYCMTQKEFENKTP